MDAWMNAPLNYLFSIFFFRKSTEGCDRLCQGYCITELQAWHCSSIHSNIFNVHVQRANYSSRACVGINRCSVICWSCSCYSIEGKDFNKIPGLCVAKGGKQVTFTVDHEVGRALFKACAWSDEENEWVLNKAAKIVWKDLLFSDEIFDGDVSDKRQSRSVPNSLVKLISMILEGGKPSRELSAVIQKVSVNLSQLINFNSVKQKCREKHRNFATPKTTNHRYQFRLV